MGRTRKIKNGGRKKFSGHCEKKRTCQMAQATVALPGVRTSAAKRRQSIKDSYFSSTSWSIVRAGKGSGYEYVKDNGNARPEIPKENGKKELANLKEGGPFRKAEERARLPPSKFWDTCKGKSSRVTRGFDSGLSYAKLDLREKGSAK